VSLAGIDCGTNSIRLLVGDVDEHGRLHESARLMEIVRLGEGIDRTGEFSAAALDRTFSAIDRYAAVMTELGVTRARFVATSASRDARNRDAFVAGVRERLGIEPEVISGLEEAALSFTGAIRGLPGGLVVSPPLVVDIGGGSTEFVLGSEGPEHSVSVDIGCVRMTERHLHSDPPTPAEIDATWRDVKTAVETAGTAVPFGEAGCLVGLAGTVTTVAAMAMDLPEYDAEVLHGSVISTDEVADVTDRLLAMTKAERAVLPFMHPGRVDVIAGGAMVLLAALQAAAQDRVIVSETDILDGIVYTIAAQTPQTGLQRFM
jgi:exopolyphosphatase/guanosine-5'-triphosphate,3'-diphosphate pyrophosphatase